MAADFPAAGTCRRLRDALTGPREAGWQDLAALIRQVLLEQVARQGIAIPLRVPGASPFPTREQWRLAECEATEDGPEFSVTARPWHPPIGPGESGAVAEQDMSRTYRGTVRSAHACAADPFWGCRARPREVPTLRLRWPAPGGADGRAGALPVAPPSSACRRARARQKSRWRPRCRPAGTGAFPSWSCRPWCSLSTWSGGSVACCRPGTNGRARTAVTPTPAASGTRTRKTCAGSSGTGGSAWSSPHPRRSSRVSAIASPPRPRRVT